MGEGIETAVSKHTYHAPKITRQTIFDRVCAIRYNRLLYASYKVEASTDPQKFI